MKDEEEILKALYEIKKGLKYIKGAINGMVILVREIKEIKDYLSSNEFKKKYGKK